MRVWEERFRDLAEAIVHHPEPENVLAAVWRMLNQAGLFGSQRVADSVWRDICTVVIEYGWLLPDEKEGTHGTHAAEHGPGTGRG